MNSATAEVGLSAAQWWAARRLRYNLALVGGAAVSFLSLAAVGWLFAARLPCLEITVFSVAVGGVLFLVGVGLANLCYYLGPLSERWLHPKNLLGFRRLAFALGTAFSLALIFLPVAGNLAVAVFAPAVGGQCE
jgi:hypothetical protein